MQYQQPAPMQYQQPVPVYVQQVPVAAPGNGMAVASLILGIVAIVFGVIPLIGIFVAGPCALLAFIFGIVGIVKGTKIHRGLVMAVIGLVLSIIAGVMFSIGGGLYW